MKILFFLSLFISSGIISSSQIILPKDFNRCTDGSFTAGKVSISSFETGTIKSIKIFKKEIDNNSEMCCGTTTVTKDGLLIHSGSFDTEGEGAGDFFYKIYNPRTNSCVMLTSLFNNSEYKDWCAWTLRTIRNLSSEKNNKVINHKGKACK